MTSSQGGVCSLKGCHQPCWRLQNDDTGSQGHLWHPAPAPGGGGGGAMDVMAAGIVSELQGCECNSQGALRLLESCCHEEHIHPEHSLLCNAYDS